MVDSKLIPHTVPSNKVLVEVFTKPFVLPTEPLKYGYSSKKDIGINMDKHEYAVHANSKASKKVKLDVNKIKEYWEKAASADHPGAWGANVVGLYGDDCKYNNVGKKKIVIAMNLVLFEPKSSLFSSLIHFRWAGLYILFGSFFSQI